MGPLSKCHVYSCVVGRPSLQFSYFNLIFHGFIKSFCFPCLNFRMEDESYCSSFIQIVPAISVQRIWFLSICLFLLLVPRYCRLLIAFCSKILISDAIHWSLYLSLFIPCQSESKVNPDSVKEAKSSKTKESGDEETKGDLEVTTAEANENTSPSESHHIAEGGKKDPNLRRQELLVDSGLAEVCCFNLLYDIFNQKVYHFYLFAPCCLYLLLLLHLFFSTGRWITSSLIHIHLNGKNLSCHVIHLSNLLWKLILCVLQNLIDTCIESAGELLRSNFGKEVMYEVAILSITSS